MHCKLARTQHTDALVVSCFILAQPPCSLLLSRRRRAPCAAAKALRVCFAAALAQRAIAACAPCVLVSATPAALAPRPRAERDIIMEAQQGAQAVDTPVCYFAQLPHALLLLILALLPVDTRLRCAEVCRGWHASLVDASLWLHLALSPESGVTCRVTDALLRATAARAGGALLSLAVVDCLDITRDALLAVATENAATLREARLCIGAHDRDASRTCWVSAASCQLTSELSCQHLEALLRAAPLLRTLHADVVCGAAEARRLLRNEPPFQVLRVRRLKVVRRIFGDEAATLELAADVTTHAAAHASMEQLYLFGTLLHAPAALDAIG